jgi:hypothetical protein
MAFAFYRPERRDAAAHAVRRRKRTEPRDASPQHRPWSMRDC